MADLMTLIFETCDRVAQGGTFGTVTKEWVGAPVGAPADPPPGREQVCHVAADVITGDLYRSRCGKLVSEPMCCDAPETNCGRPPCADCNAISARLGHATRDLS